MPSELVARGSARIATAGHANAGRRRNERLAGLHGALSEHETTMRSMGAHEANHLPARDKVGVMEVMKT
jgi:hypothetical protein